MSSDEPKATPQGSLVPLLALLLALTGLLATDWAAVDRGALRSAMTRDLVRIAELANLRSVAPADPARASMPVTVVQEGGPLWIADEASAAVDADPIFTRGEPHVLRIEVVEHARTYGIRGQLWRQGWSLRSPEPLWVSPAPWIVLFSALAGAGWAALRGRMGGGLMVAGLLAQGLSMGLPWPASFTRPSLQQTWRDGPAGHAVVELARGLPDVSVAVGAGVITLCVLLMLFDHRRSAERGGGLLLSGLLGVMGAAAWIEASLRVGLAPWMTQSAGWAAMAGVVGLWWWAWRRRRLATPESST